MKKTHSWGQHSPESTRKYYKEMIAPTIRDREYCWLISMVTGKHQLRDKLMAKFLWNWFIAGIRTCGAKAEPQIIIPSMTPALDNVTADKIIIDLVEGLVEWSLRIREEWKFWNFANNYGYCGTVVGRLSSKEPNICNIPKSIKRRNNVNTINRFNHLLLVGV